MGPAPLRGDGGGEMFPCSEVPTHGDGTVGTKRDLQGIGGSGGEHFSPACSGPSKPAGVPGLNPHPPEAPSGCAGPGPELPPKPHLSAWVLGLSSAPAGASFGCLGPGRPEYRPQQGLRGLCGSQRPEHSPRTKPPWATQVLTDRALSQQSLFQTRGSQA